jgi:predicted tellurium resistance membrane protein TerC
MSRERAQRMRGLVFLEKISGFILAVIGATLAYNTSNELSSLGAIGYLILAASVVVLIMGLLLIIAKPE